MKRRILFVCLGNICRSPAANGILEHMAAERGVGDLVEVDSAGTYSGHAGDLPDPRMRRAAARRGYELAHRARTVRCEDFDRFDMIVAMDDSNYEALCRLAPEREQIDKIFRMRDFLTGFPDWRYVPDPYYEGPRGFELVLDMLEEGCANILDGITGKSLRCLRSRDRRRTARGSTSGRPLRPSNTTRRTVCGRTLFRGRPSRIR